MNQSYMKEKPVFPLVLTMALPMVLSMLVNALYNIVDSYFVAKINEDAMTALSLVFPLQNLISAAAIGFGVGLNAVVSFFLGAERKSSANAAITQGTLLSIVHGVLLTAICISIIPAFLQFFTPNEVIIGYGLEYSNIVFLFATAVNVGISFEKIFQSVGKMKVSMFSMMSGCIVNILLDPFLIFGIGFFPAMGIQGAALATGIGQMTTLVIYLICFHIMEMPVSFCIGKNSIKEKIYPRLYAVGIPATLNMALPSLLITVLNGILAEYSQMYVLILGIYYKLQTFIYLTANGIVQGIRPLIGYNYGAGRKDRVQSIYRTALAMGACIMAVGTLLCILIPEQIIGMFSTSPQTISEGAKALTIISYGFILSTVSVMASGCLEGLGEGMPSLVISLIRYIAIIPLAFLLCRLLGVIGVWHSFWITEVIAALISFLLLRHCLQKLFKNT